MTDAAGSGGGDALNAILGFRAWDFATKFTPLEVSTPTLVPYLLTTTDTLAAGIWQINVTFLVIGSASGTDISTDFRVDGIPFGPLLSEASVAGGGFLLSGPTIHDFTGGDATHEIGLFVAQPAGPGVVTALFATQVWERKR